jgi:Domain of unknown function (DUF5069)
MAAADGLRSAYAKVNELIYFGRMLDKIRLADANKLPSGYNLGDYDMEFIYGETRLAR